jgi:plastocyanin
MNMAGVDKFGIIFTIAFAAAMIAIMGGLLQVDTSSSTPSIAAPTQTYSPPPTPAATQPSVTPQAAPQTSDSDNLKYTIRGGIVDSITKDENHNAVKIMMDTRFDGQITITLTSDSVTPFDDGTYFVTIDGEEVDFTHVGKKLIIDFMANSQKIMIFGDGHKSDGHDAKDEAMMADKAVADKAVADKAVADKAAADKAVADKAVADKAVADKAVADKAAADKAAADKAAADKAAADKAAADKAAADKAAADKAAADKAAAAKAPMAVTIEPVAGSGAPGCEPECYSPSSATISAGGKVTFDNTDTAPHTATSGSAANGPDGIWDSSLIMTNASYSVTLPDSGNYTYFCMVHPWMEGTVIVE